MAYGDCDTYRKIILHAAAKLFLEKGYSTTTLKELAKCANVDINVVNRTFGSKENILAGLVGHVLNGQFDAAHKLLDSKTDDKILYYAGETTLQLYITESSEQLRDLYTAAYSLPVTTRLIQDTITEKLQDIFGSHLPHLESKDFYEREIASGGIMRNFMTIPCDRYFTMERKVAAFLECTFKIYDVPPKKIQEAIEFVSQFDYPTIAKNVIEAMIKELEENSEFGVRNAE